MVEYIERDVAIRVACKGCNKEFPNEPCEPAECNIQQGLFNIPAADVVPVVRCKDCEHTRKKSKSEEQLYAEDTCVCTRPDVFGQPENEIVWNDHFCSYGERREGE